MHPARLHSLSGHCCAMPCQAVDDDTSMLMELRFAQSESTFSYFEALESYLLKQGRPVAFYSDKKTVFRVPKPDKQMRRMTQFGRALAELNIEILCADGHRSVSQSYPCRHCAEAGAVGIFFAGFLRNFAGRGAAVRKRVSRPCRCRIRPLRDKAGRHRICLRVQAGTQGRCLTHPWLWRVAGQF